MITVIIELEKRWTVKKRKKLLAFLPPLRFRPKKIFHFLLPLAVSNNDEKIEWFWIKCCSLFLSLLPVRRKGFLHKDHFQYEKRKENSLDIFLPSSENYTPLCSLLMCVFSFFTIFPKK